MGLVTLDLPLVGQPNTTEDIKVRNNFQTLQNTINGNIDTSNLTPALLASLGANQQVYSAKQVLEVGQVGQIRAGRVLISADFTNMGLSAPLGLWNLGNINDSSGNARNLTNKGTVTFDTGITGAASEAAVFTGSTAQALYIVDTGATDPFRIRTGSWGAWFRTAKRGTDQGILSKWAVSPGRSFLLQVSTNNVVNAYVSTTGTDALLVAGMSDVCDDRWHFAVVTADGTRHRVYVDGMLEGSLASGLIFATNGPLNIGGTGADASTATTVPLFGRSDEGFITADVLSDDQVRNLYCASLGHTLGSIPSGSRLAVRRRRRGTTFAVSDFPATPVRLHNFTAGALTDEGSGAVGLTSNPGTGAIVSVAGSGGAAGNGYSFSGAHTGLSSTDAGLPAGLTARSYGLWFKTTSGSVALMGWGTITTAEVRLTLSAAGLLQALNAADNIFTSSSVNDGLWHLATVVEDNTSIDLVKRKLYVDGRVVASSAILNAITLAGANRFRIGANPDGTTPFTGQIGGAFVYAGVLTPSQVQALYNVAGQQLAVSPKSDADHIEAFETSRLLAIFDSIEGTDLVDLTVIS